jgi:hypothetical protein
MDYVNSNLILAIKEVFGRDFAFQPNLARRFVFAFNKSDLWFAEGEVTESTFLSRLSAYVEGCGLVPILVGASVDRLDESLLRDRAKGTTDFAKVVKEYQLADSRERTLYSEKFATMSSDKDLEHCLASKFRGFDTLLRTVDAIVVSRDVANAERIA